MGVFSLMWLVLMGDREWRSVFPGVPLLKMAAEYQLLQRVLEQAEDLVQEPMMPPGVRGVEAEVMAVISAADIASARSAEVSVLNPALGGGNSNSLVIAIGVPQVAIAGVQSATRDANGSTIIVQFTNIGTGLASGIRLSSVKLGTTNPSTILANPSDLAPGQSATVCFVFPGSAGATGTNSFLRITGTLTGGNFTATRRIPLP